LPWVNTFNESILSYESNERHDLVFSKGVLIHINPDELERVYKKFYDMSKKYILIVEYYNPTPIEINYRGHSRKLFKRDFTGELIKLYQEFRLNQFSEDLYDSFKF